jgi:hypothetical protein
MWYIYIMDKYEYGYTQERNGNSPTGFRYSIYKKDVKGNKTSVEPIVYDTMAEVANRLVQVRQEGDLFHAKEYARLRQVERDESLLNQRRIEEQRVLHEERLSRQRAELMDRTRAAMNNIDHSTFGQATERRRKEEKPTVMTLQKEVKNLTEKIDRIIMMLDTGLTNGDIDLLNEDLQIDQD